jgi:hypothetical protein
MTGQQRILATLAGEAADRVPFVPNIWQWFHVNRVTGRLPGELQGMHDPIEVLRHMGADLFSKFDGKVVRERLGVCRRQVIHEGEPTDASLWTSFTDMAGRMIRRDRIETPHGKLSQAWHYAPEAGAPFEAEHWWKDFDRDYPAIRAWMQDRRFEIDRAELTQGLQKIGSDGVILFQLLPSPLKQLHWLAGQEQATLFIADHPQEMHALAEIHAQQSLRLLEEAVALPGIWIYEVPDNLDSAFYSPRVFRAFCLNHYRRMAEMLHARGKYLFVHACGRLRALAPLIVESNLDSVEGQPHPPLGDWHLHEARAYSSRLILCGGMTAHEQEWTGPGTRQRLAAHVQTLFASLGDRRRFLFGSGCNTSPAAPYENLLALRDAALEFGRL